MQFRRRWLGWCLVLALGTTTLLQNCLCAQNLVIPGAEFASPGSDGGGQAGAEPSVDGVPDFSGRKEQPSGRDDTTSDFTTTPEKPTTSACPNGVDVVCFPCKFLLQEKEKLLLVHRDYALVSGDSGYRRISLATCQSQPFPWSFSESIRVLAQHSDSSKVLLAAESIQGKPTKLTLVMIDLANPAKPLQTFPVTGNVRLTQYRVYGKKRRGLVFVDVLDSKGRRERYQHIHFDFSMSRLVEMSWPLTHTFEPSGQTHLFVDHELYVLRYEVEPKVVRFPIAVWSVQQQKIVQIIYRGNRPYPQQMFATVNNVYVLERDPNIRNVYDLVKYPIAGGPSLEVPLKGCKTLWGDNQVGMLGCATEDTVHLYKLPGMQAIAKVNLPEVARALTYYPGFWYFMSLKNENLYRVPFKTGGAVKKLSFKGSPMFVFAGPRFPNDRTNQSLPGLKYRVFRDINANSQKIGIMNAETMDFQWLKDDFPVPAVMGRMTEMSKPYKGLYTYYVEPMSAPQKPSIFVIRTDSKPALIYQKDPALSPEVSSEVQILEGSALKVVAVNVSEWSGGDPSSWKRAILLVDLQSYAKQRMTLDRPHVIHNVANFVVLEPRSLQQKQREVTVYKVPAR